MKIKFSSFILGLTALIITISTSYSHTDHYKNFKKLEMDVYKDGEIIGFSNYEFSSKSNELFVKNITEFKVKVLGVKVFSVLSQSEELYKNGSLIYFKSRTIQNNKKKYVDLKYLEDTNEFLIDGSSYKGRADKKTIIGNWWNHDILKAKSQISPISGSIKKQKVKFIGKEIIKLNEKEHKTEHYKLLSNENISEDRKLDFDIWYSKDKNIILKISYKKFGDWEYRLKNIKLY
tara:strand:+ start:462 stop:1160 length:699 start_codon:yes stop_codon:yes gene_type:complete